MNLNSNYDYWIATFSKWKKAALKPLDQDEKHCGRGSVVGKEVEAELVLVVERYNEHGIPLTDTILRCALLSLLTKHGKDDIMFRLTDAVPVKDRLRLGRRWCQRFYNRHKFVSRAATTKMRDEIPADYDDKKETFILHLSKAIHDHNIPDELIIG